MSSVTARDSMQARGISSLIVAPRYAGDRFGIVTKVDVIAKL